MILLSRHFRVATRSLAAGVHFYSSRAKFLPSLEQKGVIDALKTHNVVVTACPGAGKTATIEGLVKENPDTPVAVITYSKRLKIETEKRLRKYDRVDVFTFHGLAGKLFGHTIQDDAGLIQERKKKDSVPNLKELPQYRFVVLDEIQDMTDDLYWVAGVLITSITQKYGDEHAPKILALGDARQAIYQFRGADTRFIQEAPDIFHSISKYGWKWRSLAQSFRLSVPMANFVNDVFLGGQEYIVGTGPGVKPTYLLDKPRKERRYEIPGQKDKLYDFLIDKIRHYGPTNCAILSPSVRGSADTGYLARFSTHLSVTQRYPVSASIYEDAPLCERITRGKLIVSTYHQFKGVERDLIIVFGADATWFKIFGRDLLDNSCPNPIFVALTRARKELIMIHSVEASPLSFMDITALSTHANIVPLEDGVELPKQIPPGRPSQVGLALPKRTHVTDLIRHMSDKELYPLVYEHKIVTEHPPLQSSEWVKVENTICTKKQLQSSKNLYETVADLSGTAVTRAFWFNFTKGASELAVVPEDSNERAIWFAKAVTDAEARRSGFYCRRVEMGRGRGCFEWLVGHLDAAVERIHKELAANGVVGTADIEFEPAWRAEFRLPAAGGQNPASIMITGVPDIVSVADERKQRTIWEIKFTDGLTLPHIAQTILYGWLWAKANAALGVPFPRLRLFNARTGECREIKDMSMQAADKFVEGLLRAKYQARQPLSDEEFLSQCNETSSHAKEVVGRSTVRSTSGKSAGGRKGPSN